MHHQPFMPRGRAAPSFGGHGRRGGLGLFFLAMQVARIGYNNIPPVTLGLMLINIGIFYIPSPFGYFGDNCIGIPQVIFDLDRKFAHISCSSHL
jgi:hypothetical protein